MANTWMLLIGGVIGFFFALVLSIVSFLADERFLSNFGVLASSASAFAAGLAAYFTSKAAGAAFQSANQWRDQKHHDLVSDSVFDAMCKLLAWRSHLISARSFTILDGGKLDRSSFFVSVQSYGDGVLKKVEEDAFRSKELWEEARVAIHRCRYLGVYSDDITTRLERLQSRYFAAVMNFVNGVKKSSYSDVQGSAEVAICINSGDDSFGNDLHSEWIQAELFLKSNYDEMRASKV